MIPVQAVPEWMSIIFNLPWGEILPISSNLFIFAIVISVIGCRKRSKAIVGVGTVIFPVSIMCTIAYMFTFDPMTEMRVLLGIQVFLMFMLFPVILVVASPEDFDPL